MHTLVSDNFKSHIKNIKQGPTLVLLIKCWPSLEFLDLEPLTLATLVSIYHAATTSKLICDCTICLRLRVNNPELNPASWAPL